MYDAYIIAGSGAYMDSICKKSFHKYRCIPYDKWSAENLLFLQTAGANKAA